MTEKYYEYYLAHQRAKNLTEATYDEFITFIETASDQEYEDFNNNLRKFVWNQQ